MMQIAAELVSEPSDCQNVSPMCLACAYYTYCDHHYVEDEE